MKVLLWGVPCVGKVEVGKLLAEKLNLKFIDMTAIVKEKYGTVGKFQEKFPNAYDEFKEKEKIALNVINNNDNFVMVITLIYIKEIVDNITNTDTISVELVDSVKSIYDRILFYDENDEVMSDSKQYRDEHKAYYMNQVKNDKLISISEYKDIPKFNINDRKFNDIIDELSEYVLELAKKKQ